MRQLRLVVRHLAYVVQQAGAAGFLGVEAEFRSHDGAQVGSLTRVLQQVLAVRTAVFHASYHAYKLRVQAVDAEVDGRAFAGLDNLLLHLTAHLCNNLLDACRVYAAVHNELVQGEAGDFAAYRVETGKHNRLGSVIDDDFHASCSFESADVAALAADNLALDFVVVNVEHGDGVLDGSLCGDALNRLYDNALGLLAGGHLGIVHDVVDIALGSGLGLVLERLDEFLTSLVGRKAGDMLQFLTSLQHHLLCLVVALLYLTLAVVERGGTLVKLVAPLADFALLVTQLHLYLLGAGLCRLHALHLLGDFALCVVDELQALLLGFEQLLLAYHVSLAASLLHIALRVGNEEVGVGLGVARYQHPGNEIPGCRRHDCRYQYPYKCIHICYLYSWFINVTTARHPKRTPQTGTCATWGNCSGIRACGERRHTPFKWQNLPAVKPAKRNCGGHRCPSRSSRLASICSMAAAASP